MQPASVWQWQRSIDPDDEFAWRAKLGGIDSKNIALISAAESARSRLTVYSVCRAPLAGLKRRHGGRVLLLKPAAWSNRARQTVSIPIGRRLVVVENRRAKKAVAKRLPGAKTLIVPAGMAFGSGSHATTGMILREMARIKNWKEITALDIGTGSGILALAARAFGAHRVVAIDNDPIAIRVARENEARNFARRKVVWGVADLSRWRAEGTYPVVVANLYSEILCHWAKIIWTATSPGGRVILSGILAHQEREVRAAWRRACNAKPVLRRRKGRWVMLVYAKKA